MPEAYGIESGSRGELPILPETFRPPAPRQKRQGYKPIRGRQTARRPQGLFSRAERIVVATDAGREGELIFPLLSITISTARRPSIGCGSAASPSRPSARGWQPYVPAASTTISTSRPVPAAGRWTGSWASTHPKLSPSPPDAVHGRWAGVQTPYAGAGVRALSGKYLVHAADLFPAQTPHGQRRYGVRRPLDAEIRYESDGERACTAVRGSDGVQVTKVERRK